MADNKPTINFDKRDRQERQDFETAKQIFSRLFSKYNISIEKQKDGALTDMRIKVYRPNGDVINYVVEIKSRTQSLEDYDTLPLTCSKYCNILSAANECDKPIVIYLLNGEEYYIYDLNRIDWNKVECRHWYINNIEFASNGQQKVNVPTFFLPVSQSVYNGLYN